MIMILKFMFRIMKEYDDDDHHDHHDHHHHHHNVGVGRRGWSVVMRLTRGGFTVIYTRKAHRSGLFEISTTSRTSRI